MKMSAKRAQWLGQTIELRMGYASWPNEMVHAVIPFTKDFLVNSRQDEAIKHVFLPVWRKMRRAARKAMPK